MPLEVGDALWLGPDEWLVVGEGGAAFEGADAIVDVSAARAVLELAGDARMDLLEQVCTLDLHPSRWRAGMCTQTLLAHVPVILQERKGDTRIYVRPSFANHLVDQLLALTT
jgi:sarcosine oxidase subunit gamma